MRVLLVCALLVLALIGTAAPGVASASTGSSSSTCSSVQHDSFRISNSTVAEIEETGEATITEDNVEVTVEDTSAFVRVKARNPNGYCVDLTVQISEEVVVPADLGSVRAVQPDNTDLSAQWESHYSLGDDERFTEISVELPAGSDEFVFAPDKARLTVLSWTAIDETEADGLTDNITDRFRDRLPAWLGGEPDLEQTTYEWEGNATEVHTISLESDDGRQVEDWYAYYDTGDGYVPVSDSSSDPVFYQEGENTIRLYYNDNATVEFIANPGWGDHATDQYRSYRSSWRSALSPITDGLLGMVLLVEFEAAAEVRS